MVMEIVVTLSTYIRMHILKEDNQKIFCQLVHSFKKGFKKPNAEKQNIVTQSVLEKPETST